jgi:sugar/nucleoside kinase (ribokinase family)
LIGATYKAKTTLSAGGVGRNLADGLYKLNGSVSLISAFGNDSNGEYLRKSLPPDATTSSAISNDVATASCAIILDKNGDSQLHVGDMNIHREITPELVSMQA